jgi:hypothetical protein
MSIAALNTLYTAAEAALDADDFDGAIKIALKAKMRLATMPNVSRAVGQGSQAIAWANAVGIDNWIAEVRKLKNASLVAAGGPFMQTKVVYQRAEATGDDA